MSNVSEQTAPEWQQTNLDPKAAAKAAKAYAKATRPFYKKKRYMIPAAILVVAVISQGASGGEKADNGPKLVETETAAGSNAAPATKAEKPAKKPEAGTRENPVIKGQTVELEGTRYTVGAVETAPTVGGEFFQEKANGVYVIVTLTIENTKDESRLFSDSAAKFVAGDDTSYDTDTDATIAGAGEGEDPLFLAEMHPDLPTTGKLIFDVPPVKLKGGLLEVSDLFGKGEAYIKLGL